MKSAFLIATVAALIVGALNGFQNITTAVVVYFGIVIYCKLDEIKSRNNGGVGTQ